MEGRLWKALEADDALAEEPYRFPVTGKGPEYKGTPAIKLIVGVKTNENFNAVT